MNALDLFTLKPSPFKLDSGNVVYIRRVSAAERAQWADSIPDRDTADSLTLAEELHQQALFLLRSLVNKDGKPLFSNVDDVREIDTVTLGKLWRETLRVNTFTAEAIEDVKKKSETTSGSSASSVTS